MDEKTRRTVGRRDDGRPDTGGREEEKRNELKFSSVGGDLVSPVHGHSRCSNRCSDLDVDILEADALKREDEGAKGQFQFDSAALV